MKIEDIHAWEVFLAVSSQGNFSKAAKALRVPVPQVSKKIAKLENHLGIRLFQRTTRSVSLTVEGKSLYPKISSIIEDLKEAESLFEDKQNLQGTVKITCVPFLAHKLLLPALDKFTEKYPHINIELELGESFTNIIEAGFDMAIRIETPKDSELIYRRLAPNDLIFCASADYLKKNNSHLKKPEDLKKHQLLILDIHHRCKFQQQSYKLQDFIESKKISCHDGVFLTSMALAGMGILVRSIWDVQEHLKSGKLIQVLKDHPLETFGHIHAVIPSKRFLAPRVRAFLDFVISQSKSWNLNNQ